MKKKAFRILMIIIIVFAFAVRLGYVIKMPYCEKQHDVEPDGNALSYVFTIYKSGALPETNAGQLYHPPLHNIIAAGYLKIIDGFYENPSDSNLAEGLQYLTLIYSMLIIGVSYKIFKELKFNRKIRLLMMFIIAFHPGLIILSGSLNNDQLCLLLMLCTIWRLIKWFKKDSARNTLILAIFTGLSVMTKLTGALVAFPIIFTFIYKIIRDVKKSKNKAATIKKHFFMYLLFGLVSLPIGLWYPIRNYLLFGQGILYIPTPGGAPDPSNFLYVGDRSLYDRLTLFSGELLKNYCLSADDCNMISYLIKCSIFGEYNWGITGIVYNIALISNIVLIAYTLYCIIINVIKKGKRNRPWKSIFSLTWLFIMLSYLKVNLNMPFGCTMDFRYIYLNLFMGLIFIGFELSKYRKRNLAYKISYRLVWTFSIMLAIFSNYILFMGS